MIKHGVTTSFRLGTYRIIDKDDDNRLTGTLDKRKNTRLFAGRILIPTEHRRLNQMAVRSQKYYCCSVRNMWSSAQELWQWRLGKTSIPLVRDMISDGKYGMRQIDIGKPQVCEICVQTKNTNAVCDGNLV